MHTEEPHDGSGERHRGTDHEGSNQPRRLLGDRYELEELIGLGGVAEVWRAHDVRLRREVAVKILSGPATRDPGHRRRIEREARALAAIAHPNVVGIYDYGEQPAAGGEPIPYLVMELADGPDLARHLAARGPIEPSEAVRLIAGVLAGVEQAHTIGIVHGDLKPANILLAPDGPKVSDFGVARILAEETGTTSVAATPTYAPPEVLRGERPSPASDVYSVACVAVEILTGQPPFDGSTFWELSRQHQEDPPPALRRRRPELAAHLEGTVLAGLAKDPRDRPPTAAAFAALLTDSPATVPTPAPAAAVSPAPPTEPVRVDPTQQLPVRTRRTRVHAAVGLARRIPPGVAIALLGVLLLVAMRDAATAATSVPELRQMTVGQATELATQAGFEILTSEVDAGGLAGTVVEQHPSPGTLRARGSTIELQVSLGAPQVAVPDVTGRSVADARTQIESAGLTVESVTFHPDSEAAPGTVERTFPAAGESVDEGTPLTIVAAPVPAPAPDNDDRSAPAPGNDKDDDKDDDDDERGSKKRRGPPGRGRD